MNETQNYEDEIVDEMKDKYEEIKTTNKKGTSDIKHIVMPPKTLEEINRKVIRASQLSPNALLRIGERFMIETDSELQ